MSLIFAIESMTFQPITPTLNCEATLILVKILLKYHSSMVIRVVLNEIEIMTMVGEGERERTQYRN